MSRLTFHMCDAKVILQKRSSAGIRRKHNPACRRCSLTYYSVVNNLTCRGRVQNRPTAAVQGSCGGVGCGGGMADRGWRQEGGRGERGAASRVKELTSRLGDRGGGVVMDTQPPAASAVQRLRGRQTIWCSVCSRKSNEAVRGCEVA